MPPMHYKTRKRKQGYDLEDAPSPNPQIPDRNLHLYQPLKVPGKKRVIYIVRSETDFIRALMNSGYTPYTPAFGEGG